MSDPSSGLLEGLNGEGEGWRVSRGSGALLGAPPPTGHSPRFQCVTV